MQGEQSIAIGRSASTDTGGSMAIGDVASTTAGSATAIGGGAHAAGNCIALGTNATATAAQVGIAIGIGAITTASNQMVIGGPAAMGITSVYIGNGVTSATPVSFTLNATGAFGANLAGADLKLAGGQGTGLGVGGSVHIQVSPAGSSGVGPNALVDAIVVSPTYMEFTVAGSTVQLLSNVWRPTIGSVNLGDVTYPWFSLSTKAATITGPLAVNLTGFSFKINASVGLQYVTSGTNAWANFGTTASTTPSICWYDSTDVEAGRFMGTGEFNAKRRVFLGAPATAPSGAALSNSQVSFSVDEVNNKLIFTVKYSNGTVKTGSADLL